MGFNFRTKQGTLFPPGGNVSPRRLDSPGHQLLPNTKMLHVTNVGVKQGEVVLIVVDFSSKFQDRIELKS